MVANGSLRKRRMVCIVQGWLPKDTTKFLGLISLKIFAPVVNDVTICTVMMLLLFNPDWIAYIVDVETAFLYGKMDVDLYMEIPEGLQHFEDVNPVEKLQGSGGNISSENCKTS